MRALLRSVVVAGVALGCAGPDDTPPVRHVIVICIDTLRADHVGSYGYARGTTPGLDSLAAAGCLFDRALAHSPWTVPSTASLLTSRIPSGHGAEIEGEQKFLEESPPSQIRAGVPLVSEVLSRRGFHTGIFSANPFLTTRFCNGFDEVAVRWRSAAELFAEAAAWFEATVDSDPKARVFLYMQPIDLHNPIQPPEEYWNLFPAESGGERGEQHRVWRFGKLESVVGIETGAFRRFRDHKIAVYDGALRYIDSEMTAFLARVRALGQLDETVIVVTSDHGEEFWDHMEDPGQRERDPRGVWGIGHGHTMYQELLHVPLVVTGPGVRAGAVERAWTGLIDVAPTLMDLLGLDPAESFRGRSFAATLRGSPSGNGDGGEPGRPLIAEAPAYGPEARAVVLGDYKLVARGEEAVELYDLSADPGERTNLLTERGEAAAELEKVLAEEVARDGGEDGAPGIATPMEFTPEETEALRTLGYLN